MHKTLIKLTTTTKKMYSIFMKLVGMIENVIYRNDETGYTILDVTTNDGSIITTTGKFPVVGICETVTLEGEFKINPRYGEQFVASSIEISKPKTNDSIIKYLSCGLISGVGIVTATSIVNMFGEKTLDVIENDHEKLARVKGVSIRKANDIHASYTDIKKMQNAVMFLQNYDITINLAVKIFNEYGDKTETILKNNPYQLIEDIEGISFKTADKIASRMGVEHTSSFRLKAAILFVMNELSERIGGTVVKTSDLLNNVLGLLEFSEELSGEIEREITSLEIEGLLRKVDFEDDDCIILSKMYFAEKFIADKIKLLQNSVTPLSDSVDLDIEEFQRENNISLHNCQIDAIKTSTTEGFLVITGGPGTGKTTIIKAIIKIFKKRKFNVTLLAPTGRAAKRMEEQSGMEAKTIHRGLEVNFNTGRLSFARNDRNPLETDVIIIDEVSMLDIRLAQSLLKAISLGTRVILVGDKDQLPSVGAGNILADIIRSNEVSCKNLVQIYRQADDSKIIVNAHKINNGEMPNLSEKSTDFFYSGESNPENVIELIVQMVKNRIPSYDPTIFPKDIQIISPIKTGICGVNNINKALQQALNPASSNKKEKEINKTVFRVGDRVMQICNDYEQTWYKEENGLIINGEGVFNGDIGIIEDINSYTGEINVLFEDGRRSAYSIVELENLTLAYAMTIHKSQGSEFPVVIIPIIGGNPVLFNKNLLYTAVTRAKKMVVLIGKSGNIYYMIKNNYMTKRNCMLYTFLKNGTLM